MSTAGAPTRNASRVSSRMSSKTTASNSSQYSDSTQKLMKQMMKDAKLTPFQQRQLEAKMKSGETLPSSCNPHNSKYDQENFGIPILSVEPESKKIDVRTYAGGVKSLDTILASDAFEPDTFKPAPGKDHEKEKQRLQKVMYTGRDSLKKKKTPKRTTGAAPIRELDPFDEILEEIEERRAFLDDMYRLGKGKEYDAKIRSEISQRIRQLEVIDRDRSKELASLEPPVHAVPEPGATNAAALLAQSR